MKSDLVSLSPDARTLRLNLHPGQWRAWKSEARFVAILAGAQSGKTSFAPHWLYREIQSRGPGDYLYVTPTFPLLELKALPELMRVLRQWLRLGEYVGSPRRVFTFSDEGCRRTFGPQWDPLIAPPTRILFGYATDPESLESATARAAVCDEAGQKKFRLESWEAILRRLSLSEGRVLITTSVYSLGWLQAKYERWLAGDRDWDFIQFDSTLNPGFPEQEFERARRDLPPWRFDMLYRGLFTRPAGLIFDCYSPQHHRCKRFPIPGDWKRYLGLDFGKVNTAGVFLARDPDTEQFYAYRTYHEGGRSAEGHVRALSLGEPEPELAFGGAPSEKDWRSEFRTAGLTVREPPVSEVEVGIDRIYGALQQGRLVLFNDLDELNGQFLSYSRVLDDDGQPTEAIDSKSSFHLLDALRYVLSGVLGGSRSRLHAAHVEFYR